MKQIWMIVAGLAVALGAQAQTKKELAAKLVQLQQPAIENLGRSIANQEAQRYLQAAGRHLQRVPADKRDALGKEVQADIKKFYDEIEPLLRERAAKLAPTLVPMLEERFSEDELKQIIAWVESPVSRKFGELSGEFSKALADKLIVDARPAVEPKVKALDASLAKRLGLPAPGASAPAGASAPKK